MIVRSVTKVGYHGIGGDGVVDFSGRERFASSLFFLGRHCGVWLIPLNCFYPLIRRKGALKEEGG